MNPPEPYVWHCPSCGRHVPRRVETCRCGFGRPGDPGPVEAPISDTPHAPAGRRGMPLLLIGLLLGLGLAAIPLRSLWPDTTVRLPSTALGPGKPDTTAVPGGPLEPNPTDAAGPREPDTMYPPGPLRGTRPTYVGRVPRCGPGDPAAVSSPQSASLEDVIARALPAVVSIQAGQGRGTGFFIRPDVVLTNAHAVGEQSSVQLVVGDKTYVARVTTVSTGSDLAVLQVYNADPRQPTLRLGSVSGLRAGQDVIAIGFALGALSNTVTRGIVSAIRRTGSVTLIQADAAINPGNSGGPLVDRMGVVVGVNSMRIAAAQGGEGLAFAVAIDHAAQLLDGRASAATATPLQVLNRLMSGASASDGLREEGAQAYRKALEAAARRGADIDNFWDRYASSCVTRASRTGDRGWFAVFESNGLSIAASSGYDCQSWLTTLRTNANIIRAEVATATEAARRQGAYPGMMRDLRREHRMEWPGWER